MIAEPVWFAPEKTTRHRYVARVALFWVAAVSGAVALAGLLGWLGAALLPRDSLPVALALGVLAGLVILRETVATAVRLPQVRWQYPRKWLGRFWIGAAGFGSVMGAGVFTLQRSALFHLYVAGCLASGGIGRGALLGVVFGAAYVGVFARAMSFTTVGEPGLGVDWVARLSTRARWVGIAAAPLVVALPFA